MTNSIDIAGFNGQNSLSRDAWGLTLSGAWAVGRRGGGRRPRGPIQHLIIIRLTRGSLHGPILTRSQSCKRTSSSLQQRLTCIHAAELWVCTQTTLMLCEVNILSADKNTCIPPLFH
eukprot:350500-Chlamydomonas_euryale.AAC.3